MGDVTTLFCISKLGVSFELLAVIIRIISDILLAIVIFSGLIFPIFAGIKANNGKTWRDPLSIRFIK